MVCQHGKETVRCLSQVVLPIIQRKGKRELKLPIGNHPAGEERRVVKAASAVLLGALPLPLPLAMAMIITCLLVRAKRAANADLPIFGELAMHHQLPSLLFVCAVAVASRTEPCFHLLD